MATAREIITSALTVHLNRLSPGETLEADLAEVCRVALNEIADEFSGSGSFLWKETTYPATVTGITGTLGVTWSALSPGQDLLGVTYNNGAGDFPLDQLTMQQYHEQVRIKSLSGGLPRYWAHDGESTVYFYPACTGQTITVRVHQSMAEFADLDTDYTMPQGYKSGLSAMLAERVSSTVVGGLSAAVVKAAKAARSRLMGQSITPAIINGGAPAGNILTGWR